MLPAKKIRVLIVDDSLIFREVIAGGLSKDSNIEIVATANDVFDAYNKVVIYKPDVMTCDIEMPKMSGIQLIKKVTHNFSIPVIVVTSLDGVVFESMNAGAVDFVTKPDIKSTNNVERFINEMTNKIKTASLANVIRLNTGNSSSKIADNYDFCTNKVIAIGASTGGTEAIYSILKCLPANIPGILIVQHIPPNFSRMFAERLNNSTDLTVKEAKTGDYLKNGTVFIAPGDHHMIVKKEGKKYKIECFNGKKVNGHCPSADVLFDSVAKEAGNKAIGIILTGMGYDGARGLLSMRQNGARTIGQDEGSSIVYGMPKVAYNIGAVETQASLQRIPNMICSLLQEE